MIVYGWNSKNIKQAPMEEYECPSCHQKDSHLAIFSHYIHIFWIPLFPYKKSALISCAHCELTTEEDGMSENEKGIIKRLKSSVSIPKYHFSGMIMIFLAIAYFSTMDMLTANQKQAYIDSPQVGDVFVLQDNEEPSDYNHYLLKVTDVIGDSLLVSFNSFSYNWVADELDPEDGFFDVVYAMHKNGLKEYDEAGELKKVIRGYSPVSGFDRIIEYQLEDTVQVD